MYAIRSYYVAAKVADEEDQQADDQAIEQTTAHRGGGGDGIRGDEEGPQHGGAREQIQGRQGKVLRCQAPGQTGGAPQAQQQARITSYNVCYTKLLRL